MKRLQKNIIEQLEIINKSKEFIIKRKGIMKQKENTKLILFSKEKLENINKLFSNELITEMNDLENKKDIFDNIILNCKNKDGMKDIFNNIMAFYKELYFFVHKIKTYFDSLVNGMGEDLMFQFLEDFSSPLFNDLIKNYSKKLVELSNEKELVEKYIIDDIDWWIFETDIGEKEEYSKIFLNEKNIYFEKQKEEKTNEDFNTIELLLKDNEDFYYYLINDYEKIKEKIFIDIQNEGKDVFIQKTITQEELFEHLKNHLKK
jgi:hypothetical protein